MTTQTTVRLLLAMIAMGQPWLAAAQDTPPADPPAQAQASENQDLAGIWEGRLEVGAIQLRLVFHIQKEGETYTAKMDSPDQQVMGIPVSQVTYVNPKVTLEVKSIGGQFVGDRDAAFGELTGEWSQGGRALPLRLTRVNSVTTRSRPQNPQEPFPYRSEKVKYPHLSSNFDLAGTLTLPEGAGPFPAAILISGSGAQDRDETIFEHRPFWVLADHLTRAGLAVLRVDDRAVGESGHDGQPGDDTSKDFATDVQSGLAYLKSRPEIDASRIGLIGHSEGGLIAPLVAAEDGSVAFAILLAAPGVPGDELLYVQSAKIAKASGATDEAIAENQALQKELFRIIKTESDIAKGRQQAMDYLKTFYEKLPPEAKAALGPVEGFIQEQSAIVEVQWFRQFVTLDPRVALKQVHCPVLAMTGEKDLQVAPEQNLPEIKAALESGGNQDVTTLTMPGLNHLLQTASTGLVTEYGEIEETLAPGALGQMTDWLKLRGFAN